jgi:hypothetical protein
MDSFEMAESGWEPNGYAALDQAIQEDRLDSIKEDTKWQQKISVIANTSAYQMDKGIPHYESIDQVSP